MAAISRYGILCGLILLALAAPALGAVTPEWIVPATAGSDLSGVVVSADGRTIIAGGSQLFSLTTEGQQRWAGWSGTSVAVSHNGDYVLSSQGEVLRLLSARGDLIWDRSMDITVTDVAMAPDASVIAATGGGRVRLLTFAGEGIAANTTMAVNHIRVFPRGDRILITTNRDVRITNQTLLPVWADTNMSQDLVELSGDGDFFVTATDNRIRLYTGIGNLSWEHRFSGGNAKALAFARDGSTIVAGMDDGTVHVLNRAGTVLFSAPAEGWVTSAAVSDDGNTIVFGGMEKKVYVYNHAGTKLGSFTTKSPISAGSLAVTPDGSLIIAVDDTAVYGLGRSSFAPAPSAEATLQETTPEPAATFVTPVSTATTLRRTTTRPQLPTPYPVSTATEEAPLPVILSLLAPGLLFLILRRR